MYITWDHWLTSNYSKIKSYFVHSYNPRLTIASSMALSFASSTRFSKTQSGLQVGSPIIIVEAPKVIKTAASMPCLRANSGLVKPGDVGRIVSRKPKDLWAVRLSIGTYLLDGKYFKALELEE
ncbi:hypothetical protein Rs2_11704 [Raphanus sativus]|nr:hypothetical protein Rs2_11704 [Raphanus sativus]